MFLLQILYLPYLKQSFKIKSLNILTTIIALIPLTINILSSFSFIFLYLFYFPQYNFIQSTKIKLYSHNFIQLTQHNKNIHNTHMRQSIYLTPEEQQLSQLIKSSVQKGKCFYELYTTHQNINLVKNVFELLPAQLIRQIVSQLQTIKSQNQQSYQQNQQGQVFQECLNYCRSFSNRLYSLDSLDNRTRNGSGGDFSVYILMCCGLNITCIFGLWQLFVTIDNPFRNDGITAMESVENGMLNSNSNISNSNLVKIFSFIFYIIELIAGFWAIFGFILSGCCIAGGLKQCIGSRVHQMRVEYNFKRKIKENRKTFSKIKVN